MGWPVALQRYQSQPSEITYYYIFYYYYGLLALNISAACDSINHSILPKESKMAESHF